MTVILILAACALTTRITGELLLRRAGRWPQLYDWPRWVWRVRLAWRARRRRARGTVRARPVARGVRPGERW